MYIVLLSDVIHSSLEPIVGADRPAETLERVILLVSESTIYCHIS